MQLSAGNADFTFAWDVVRDRASLRNMRVDAPVWSGSLLPLLFVAAESGRIRPVQLTLLPEQSQLGSQGASLALRAGDLGWARLEVSLADKGVQFTSLVFTWASSVPPLLHSLHFGRSPLSAEQQTASPDAAETTWPDWRAEGFCVASARTNPIQSFFRSWDFGHANISLGSFGPAMGTPYAAAFPRPIYAACLGGRHGWACFGVGDIPDAALTLTVRARSGALERRYREDLWGAPPGLERRWTNPLWLTWASDAWEAYASYFDLFPAIAPDRPRPPRSFWGTWGDFRLDRFDLRQAVDRAVNEMEADVVCIDDPWESGKGSGRPDAARFPQFAADVAYAHQRGIGVGLWMPLAWLSDPAAEGLTRDDLLCQPDGTPVRSNWAVDPREEGPSHFCLDPSSARTREFLRERTRRLVREYQPALLKLDFGYGLPGPDACAPRDPACRGERLAWVCAHEIAEAARELDPSITVLYYSLHPLWDAISDECALDDLGDAGEHEAAGHGQWSIWAALAARRGLPLLGSSGYHWEADTDNLLNSAILGAPGANLPSRFADGTPLPAVNLARRRALFRWHRRTSCWSPLWLDSHRGDLAAEPILRNWGRLERQNTKTALTALALRDTSAVALADPALRGLRWSGRWIVLALGDGTIFDGPQIAVIPFAAGVLELPRTRPPRAVKTVFAGHETVHQDWAWIDSRIHIHVTEALAHQPLLGILIVD